MKDEFEQLATIIKEKIGSKKVYYVANPGNWGDALIRLGTIKFFRDFGIIYTEINLSKTSLLKPYLKGGVVIYGGGGGWSELWPISNKHVKRFSKRFDVIVLPSTYQGHYDITRTTYFCRDKYESKRNMQNSIFCHDMAFYLGEIPFCEGNGIGCFFRTDRESSGKIELPPSNRDLSREGNHLSDGISFFKELASFNVVHTDRLHIAIAACLLSRETHLYPGAYFKNEAVYQSSIKPYFDNVYFHKDDVKTPILS